MRLGQFPENWEYPVKNGIRGKEFFTVHTVTVLCLREKMWQ